MEKQLPDLVDCDNNEQHLFDERSDEVELVVRKHRWRWKQVAEVEDAAAEAEAPKCEAELQVDAEQQFSFVDLVVRGTVAGA